MTPIVPYLTTQLENARAILFTGAGFSSDAQNIGGERLPGVAGLKDLLWKLCFPDVPVAPDSTLQNVYEAALVRNPRGMQALLTAKLSVDGETLPE